MKSTSSRPLWRARLAFVRVAAIALLLPGLAGCEKKPESTGQPAASAAVAATSAAVTADAPVDEEAPPSQESGADANDFACGEDDEPPCPMQKWMKEVMNPAKKSGDPDELAKAFRTIADHPVDGYDKWVEIAEEGEKLAKEGDMAGAKKTCKRCHSLYKKGYVRELRDKPWGPDA